MIRVMSAYTVAFDASELLPVPAQLRVSWQEHIRH
jgi:hypothetical protein